MSGILEVRYLDSGQGDCIIMRLPDNTNVMIDCGSIKSNRVVLPEIVMAAKDVFKDRPLDIIILTHADRDHYNLLAKFLKKTNYKLQDVCMYIGNSIDLYPEPIVKIFNSCKVREEYDSGTYRTLIEPASGKKGRAVWDLTIIGVNACGDPGNKKLANENSLACLLTCNDYKFFFMGDATVKTETKILKYYSGINREAELTPSARARTVLKMGHHGSPTSTGKAFTETILPDIIIATADMHTFGKGAGHPSKQHLDMLTKWSPALSQGAKRIPIDHKIVAYDKTTKQFKLFWEGKSGRCTSMYKVNPPVGGTWSIELDMRTAHTKMIVGNTH